MSSNTLYSRTPSVAVLDNRGQAVREIRYHRHPDTPESTDERITRHQYDARGFLAQSIDARLYTLQQADSSVRPNVSQLTSLSGEALRVESSDGGISVALNDIAGRPHLAASAPGEAEAVIHRWQYEAAPLAGRLLSIREQLAGGQVRIRERFVWAGNAATEKAHNLAGQCVSHYDTAGRMQTDSIALSGVPLSLTRQLLKNADDSAADSDWQGGDTSAWNDLLATEAYITRSTADASGALLTTTDAKGNMQRMARDVAGLLAGSWLTLKGGTEQVIVKSLSWSAAGQKLREEHGNGVVTTYAYEAETQRLTEMRTERPAGHAAGAKVLQDLRYEYDPVGNVLKVRNDAEETRFWRNQKVVPENIYAYDSLYQLVSASGREMASAGQQGANLPPLSSFDNATYTHYSRTYRCDRGGNLTQIRHSAPATGNNYTTTITISGRSNRGVLSTLTETPSAVDALFTATGQQKTLLPGQSLVWTPRGELRQVTPVSRDGAGDDREGYRYDADSQRILKISAQKTANGTQEQRVLYLPGVELRTRASSGTEMERLQAVTVGEAGRAQVRVLHWESGKPAAVSNNQLRYSYDNLADSSTLEVDGGGNIISMEEYYPYGGTAVWTARSQTEADYKTVRYSGKERDASGLYYYGYRYYQPWAGRWLSADPAGTVDGLNLFGMVANSPITFSDSNGLIKTGQAARDLVGEAFVHPLHMPVFENISVEKNIAMSVREAGTYTITALGEGAAAKGHNILEKTIKPGSLKAVYGDKAGDTLQLAESSGFVGRVGQWNKAGVQGIYAHNRVSADDRAYNVNLQEIKDNELVNAWIARNIITPYTGDYDMHDIIHYQDGRGSVPGAESEGEKNVKDMINQGVAEVDPSRPFGETAMNVIRHGPQVNFVPYMWEHEQSKVVEDNGYLGVVAKPGPFPVAMVHRGEWSILEDQSELFGFYGATNTPLPEHWAQEFTERGNGMVATPYHASQLDRMRR